MNQPTSLQGTNALYLLLLIFLCIISCKKSGDVISPPFPLKVIATTPEKTDAGSAYDENVTVSLNNVVDAAKFSSGITVSCNGEPVKVTKEGNTPSYTYTWNFTTKGADKYLMTQRSTAVTDFNRDGSRMMQIGKYAYSFGGWQVPPESYNDVYRSTGDLTTWEKMPDAPWHGRHVFGIAKLADGTYVVGGDNLHSDFDVWRTTDGENWTLLTSNILGNRMLYGCTTHNGYIYIVGGAGYSDVWRSRNGIDWEPVAEHVDFLKGECFAGSLTSFKGRLWMVCGGGNGYGQGTFRKEVWSSIDGKVWKQEKDFGGTERNYTDVCVWDNKLWVISGYNPTESNIKSIWYMKPNGTWHEYETPADYIGRHATGVTVYNGKLVITCGNYFNDCWVIEKIK
jgi:N-acetylneuraminic acid mutarotase